ncbi:MAG: hypothetical protein JWR48_1591 [Mycobacterium sp.]|nr:hypothetical protein [Mycobacterium sp.]
MVRGRAARLWDLSTDASVTRSRSQLIGTGACAKVLRGAAKLVSDLDAADVVE